MECVNPSSRTFSCKKSLNGRRKKINSFPSRIFEFGSDVKLQICFYKNQLLVLCLWYYHWSQKKFRQYSIFFKGELQNNIISGLFIVFLLCFWFSCEVPFLQKDGSLLVRYFIFFQLDYHNKASIQKMDFDTISP